MNDALHLMALLGLVLVSFVYLGWMYRTNEGDEFHTANRRAGPARIVSSLFTVVGASEFVVFTTLAYVYGMSAMAFFVGTFAGFLGLSALAPVIRKSAAESDVHSIPDFARVQGMPLVAIGLSLVSVLFTGALVVIQVIIGGLLIDQLTGAGFALTAALLTAAVVAYLIWGGYRALLYTDVVQAMMLFIFTAGLAWYLWDAAAAATTVASQLSPRDVPFDLVGLAAGGFFAIFGGPEIWQRVVTSRSDRTARASLAVSGVVMLVWGWLIVLGGHLIQRLNPTAAEADAFFVFLTTGLPPWLLGVVLIALLVAMLSTADTELFAATVIVRKQLASRPDPLTDVTGTRIALVIMASVILAVSLLTQSIIDIYFWLVFLTFITGPIGLALLLRRGGRSDRTRRSVFLVALALSMAAFVVLWVGGRFVSWYPLVIALVAAVPLLWPSEDSGKGTP